jgi:uncharacterized membrane protein YccC
MFAVTLICGLSLKFGPAIFTAAVLLNAWFLVAISVPDYANLDAASSGWREQTLAWLVGAAVWMAVVLVGWLVRGGKARASHFPESKGNAPEALSQPVVLYILSRAVAVSITVAIAWGLDLPYAEWLPMAAFITMKTSLGQSTLRAEQRIVGTLIGALIATAFLLTVDNVDVLAVVILVAATLAASFYAANYAIYVLGLVTGVLISTVLANPSDAAVAQRVLYTFIGLGIGVGVTLLADLINKHSAKAVAPAT